jgi:hypothetical protein
VRLPRQRGKTIVGAAERQPFESALTVLTFAAHATSPRHSAFASPRVRSHMTLGATGALGTLWPVSGAKQLIAKFYELTTTALGFVMKLPQTAVRMN